MEKYEISKITFGDMDAVYIMSEEGNVGFAVAPAKDDKASFTKGRIDPLVQISVSGDSSSLGFCAGETRHNSGLTMSLKYVSRDVAEKDGRKKIITTLRNDSGITAEHIVEGDDKCRCLIVSTCITNSSAEEIMLESLSSFNLSGITPYADDEATGTLSLHRFRSRWSAEGRHEENTIEDLMLEPSWADFGTRTEKFGTLGSMPIRGFFPVAIIEDKAESVCWGVTNACSSSWQIEVVRNDDNLCVCGGIADYEYGHWRKFLAPGESFTTPKAYITVTGQGWENACDRMLDAQRLSLSCQSLVEDNPVNVVPDKMPSFFNEYCTTWGEPSETKIMEMLSVVNGENFDYFVIDAGWYADSVKGWQDNMGDWNVALELFPNGLRTVVDKINKAGMKAGIWFELEVVGKDADVVDDKPHLLTRDGKVIISGTRRFWDMRNQWVIDYLTKKVIDFLRDNGFEYIKIDYNDTIGIGCDGAESLGEGLRQCVNATKQFYRKIKENVPGIAIEVCSSGGHRLEPGFMDTADFLSFSDAHEEKEIPVIAADLHRLILPSKSQIWAVLRKDDSFERVTYSVCAGMYGALCISGDVLELPSEKWNHALVGVEFYKKVTPIIADGVTRKFGPIQLSNRALKDYQASVRYGKNGQALVLAHSFMHDSTISISIPLEGDFKILDKYETGNHEITIAGGCINIKFEKSFDAVAVWLG